MSFQSHSKVPLLVQIYNKKQSQFTRKQKHCKNLSQLMPPDCSIASRSVRCVEIPSSVRSGNDKYQLFYLKLVIHESCCRIRMLPRPSRWPEATETVSPDNTPSATSGAPWESVGCHHPRCVCALWQHLKK